MIVVFLDIDGVFSMIEHVWMPTECVGGLLVRPIPMASVLLRVLAIDHRFHPVWMTSWGDSALAWNERAGTKHFPVAYRLSEIQKILAASNVDGKLLAAQHYLRNHQESPVLWIEDGFVEETVTWAAQRGNVQLVDTTKEPLRSFLCGNYDDYETAAREILETHVTVGASQGARQ